MGVSGILFVRSFLTPHPSLTPQPLKTQNLQPVSFGLTTPHTPHPPHPTPHTSHPTPHTPHPPSRDCG
ncbi:hypothetical protein K9N68_08250 [Kovacikia minuta CCNUW1]|uniref:hypothetical protein n=1 Tax=Kovacikia minuta TaxID=2931930 RepID=UPI001CCFD098|nr:hypothetical protein [Kovacikia minuta]UBF27876.1 hypothetical protein K9N68_08250 [Kovacikia minuta CCNUW1]